MLWLCLFFPRLPIELRQPPESGLAAVTDRSGSRRFLIACNAPAHAAGLRPGLDATAALAREPELRLFERSPAHEQQALEALAMWAAQFSSCVSFERERWLLWLEIGASLSYFGGLEKLLSLVTASAAPLRYTFLRGIAPTPEGAALLAQQPWPAAPVVEGSTLPAALAPLSLMALALETECIDALRASGLETVGDVLSLPRDALARRFGQEATDYLQRLMGEQPDPRRRYRAPPIYSRRFDFAEPMETIESLLFPLRRILHELQGYLLGRDTALQAVRIAFRHRKQPDTVLMLRTTRPERSAPRLFGLLREKLERTELPEPVFEILLSADSFVAPGDTQLRFFDEARSADWSALLDKLRARLGEQAVKQLGLSDDHRPERAWCVTGCSEPGGRSGSELLPAAFPERPLWILEPRLVANPPQLLGKPERIEAGWWTDEDSSRDYFIAVTPEGSRWWLYREAGTWRWYLQGIWA